MVGRNVVMFCRQVVSINHLPTRKLSHGSTHPLQNAKSVNRILFYILKPSPFPHQLGYGGWWGVGWGGGWGLVPGMPPRFVNDMVCRVEGPVFLMLITILHQFVVTCTKVQRVDTSEKKVNSLVLTVAEHTPSRRISSLTSYVFSVCYHTQPSNLITDCIHCTLPIAE